MQDLLGEDRIIQNNKEEIRQLRLRLSETASTAIRQGNSTITDLGDANRPTNLAELFGELYDNEWTNAMEELHSRFKDERDKVEYLAKVLRDSDNQGDLLVKQYGKHATACQKETAHLSLQKLQQSILEEYHRGGHSHSKSFDEFLRKCIHVTWFMYTSHPPLCFIWAKPGEKFDNDNFTEYTKRGSEVEYCVWPALQLQQNGHLLKKGVVQPK